MSHLRISREGNCSPQIPLGRAHLVLSLEPTEAIRVLKNYGNPGVKVISNMRPVQSIGVISGEQRYPSAEKIRDWIREFSSQAWFLDTTKAASRLGNPVFSNVMLVGALARIGELPLDRKTFELVLSNRLPEDKVARNLQAFDIGYAMIE